jgi:uncharacterized protein (TIGR02996 family)
VPEGVVTDDQAFLAAIRASPEDDTIRLVYADWLDERGRPGGEFLRTEHALASLPLGQPRWHEAFAGRRRTSVGLSPEWCRAASRYPPSHWLAASVRSAWMRIEAALRATMPDLLLALPAGASSEAVAAAEQRLGVELPADVRASYAVHDGSGGEYDGAGIVPSEYYGVMAVPQLSLDELVRTWEMWQEWRCDDTTIDDRRDPPEGSIRADSYNARWVPLTWDGGACNLCIDLDPAPGGVSGQVIFLDHLRPKCVIDEGWWAFLERYAADLESGRLRFEGGELVAAG